MTFPELVNRVSFNRPYWLYEASPFLYIALGVWVHFNLGGGLATFSSALLILAGVHVLYMRWTYRRARAERIDDGERTLVALSWDKSCEYEHELIDGEHRELFRAARALMAVSSNVSPDLFNSQIVHLMHRLEAHFRQEEAILHGFKPAFAEERRRQHDLLANKIHTLYRGYVAGRVRRQELVECLVHEAVVGHTRQEKEVFQEAFWS